MKALLLLLTFLPAAGAQPETDPAVVLPPLDHARLLAADRARLEAGKPPHYAVPHPVPGPRLAGPDSRGGLWEDLGDGRWRWSAEIVATGASSVDLGLADFWLPQGAALTVSDVSGKVRHGPYTDRHNRAHGQLWTPVVPGERLRLELTVPAAVRDHARLAVTQVNYGYRFFNAAAAKALSCNVDVACPEGDPYRAQIRSVATYTNGAGGGICSGALVNTTAGDNTPYFLSAEHCGVTPAQAPSLVFYFNYESETCRGGSDSGMMLPRDIGDAITGSEFVAASTTSDFLLLRLAETPPPELRVFYAGWDRRDQAPSMAVGIHHPRTHEKRLAIEFDPLVDSEVLIDFGRPRLEPFTYWEVREWDVGITEGGSSGSPIFDPDLRIVGQLAGGAFFSCPGAEEGSDYYGKMSVSWEAGDTPATRLSDWLDPAGTGTEVLDGKDSCEGATISASASRTVVGTGETVDYSVSVSGGQAPYRFAWDVDGDGRVDSTLQNFQARYPDLPLDPVTGLPLETVNVSVTVTDASGCPSSDRVGLVLEAPRIELAGGEPVESCGDGDDAIEAGEIWAFPVAFTNTGTAEAADVVAVFAKAPATAESKAVGGPDAFGYTFRDSDEAFCTATAVDLTSGTVVTPDENDDGAAVVSLGGAPFSFYGEDYTQLAFTTNGYLSTDLADGGADYDNDCPLPARPDRGGGGRIMPFHDDLVLIGDLYHDFYQSCPRPADVGDPGQSCNAFQWETMEFWPASDERFSVQAFLYPESRQLAFQYLGEDLRGGTDASIGIQNPAATDALTASCNRFGTAAPGRAVCIYHPEAGPPGQSDAFQLLSPSLRLGDLAPGESSSAEVSVFIAEDFPCGSALALDYLGAAHAGGFSNSQRAGALSAVVRAGESCARDGAPCSLPLRPTVLPKSGFWFNPRRSGNGIDLHFSQPGVYGAWYTARKGGRPTWYYVQTLSGQTLENDQLHAELLSFSGPVGAAGPPEDVAVGDLLLTFLGPDQAVLAWRIDGEQRGERMQFFDLGEPGPVTAGITDQWFNEGESGWGLAVQQQGELEFSAVYFYGTDELPAWVVTLDAESPLASGETPVGAFRVHCPGCSWTTPELFEAGTLRRSFGADGASGVLDLEVELGEPVEIDWQRADLPIRSIQSIID